MIRHGVFYCRWCGYHCPVKAPVTNFQADSLVAMFDNLVAAVLPELRRLP